MTILVNPQSELIREPNLLVPGKKPVGNVTYVGAVTTEAYWLMRREYGAVARDLLRKHDGNTTNVSTVAGLPGPVYIFNGSSSQITVPDHDRLTFLGQVMTVVVTFKLFAGGGMLLYKGSTAINREYAVGTNGGGGIDWRVFTAGDHIHDGVDYDGYDYADGKWHHLVGTADGSNLRLYMDGVKVGNTVAITKTAINSNSNLYIGMYGGTSLHFDGLMGTIILDRRVWSAGEVQDSYRDFYQDLIPA